MDPTIKKFRKKSSYAGLGEFACVNNEGTELKDGTFYIGQDTGGKRGGNFFRTYLKPELPELPYGSIVTESRLVLDVEGKSRPRIFAYEVPKDWTAEKITWKNQLCSDRKKLPGKPLDYGTRGTVDLEITRSMKEWMERRQKYYGLCMIAEKEEQASGRKKVGLHQSGGVPFLTIQYRNFTGLESYWSTHDQAAGSAGTGSIQDYTGWLTFVHPDAESAGERMPLAISHAYHPAYGNDLIQKEAVSPYGNHFQLSLDARLEIPAGECDVATYPYVYTDGDGTRHYFKKKKLTYYENGGSKETAGTDDYPAAKDEDGLGLFVVPVTNQGLKADYPWKITDKSGSSCMYFDASGYLCMIRDSNQKENGSNQDQKKENSLLSCFVTIEQDAKQSESVYRQQMKKAAEILQDILKRDVNYSQERILSVEDAVGKKAQLSYDENGRLVSMTDPSEEGAAITYRYTREGNLMRIDHPCGTSAIFQYDKEGRLCEVLDENKNGIQYSYSQAGICSPVSQVTECYQKKKGQSICIARKNRDETIFTFSGADEKIGSQDDIQNIYCFDLEGHTTTVYSREKNSGTLLGAEAYTYTDSKDGEGAANKIKEKARLGDQTMNLLMNGSFENRRFWESFAENTTKGEYVIESAVTKEHFIGDRSAHFKFPFNDKKVLDPNARIGYCQTVRLPANGSYTASVYIKTNSIKGACAALNVTVAGKDQGTDSDSTGEASGDTESDSGEGEKQDTDTDPDPVTEEGSISENTPVEIDQGWKRLTRTVQGRAGDELTMTISFGGGTGEAWFDGAQVERSAIAGQYNMVDNGSFEETDENGRASYTFSAYVKADCTPEGKKKTCGFYVVDDDGVTQMSRPINVGIDGWQAGSTKRTMASCQLRPVENISCEIPITKRSSCPQYSGVTEKRSPMSMTTVADWDAPQIMRTVRGIPTAMTWCCLAH